MTPKECEEMLMLYATKNYEVVRCAIALAGKQYFRASDSALLDPCSSFCRRRSIIERNELTFSAGAEDSCIRVTGLLLV